MGWYDYVNMSVLGGDTARNERRAKGRRGGSAIDLQLEVNVPKTKFRE